MKPSSFSRFYNTRKTKFFKVSKPFIKRFTMSICNIAKFLTIKYSRSQTFWKTNRGKTKCCSCSKTWNLLKKLRGFTQPREMPFCQLFSMNCVIINLTFFILSEINSTKRMEHSVPAPSPILATKSFKLTIRWVLSCSVWTFMQRPTLKINNFPSETVTNPKIKITS